MPSSKRRHDGPSEIVKSCKPLVFPSVGLLTCRSIKMVDRRSTTVRHQTSPSEMMGPG